jgi:hypothetical protein
MLHTKLTFRKSLKTQNIIFYCKTELHAVNLSSNFELLTSANRNNSPMQSASDLLLTPLDVVGEVRWESHVNPFSSNNPLLCAD